MAHLLVPTLRPGHEREDIIAFVSRAKDLASAADSMLHRPFLLDSLLTDMEFSRTHPGDTWREEKPPAAAAADATEKQITYCGLRQDHFYAGRKATAGLFASLTANLSPVAIAIATRASPDNSLRSYTPRTLVRLFREHFATLTPADVTRLHADLQAPLTATDSAAALATRHAGIFQRLDEAGCPVAAYEQYRLFLSSITRGPVDISGPLEHYSLTHRSIDSCSVTSLLDFVADVLASRAASAIPPVSPYALMAAPSLESAPVPAEELRAEDIQRLLDLLRAHTPGTAAAVAATPPRRAGARNYRRGDDPRTDDYKGPVWCYTHGWKSHDSMACTRKGPGHKDAATATNKMGSRN